MKITRERLEAILREEIAAVAENRDSEFSPTDPRNLDLTEKEYEEAVALGYIDPSEDVYRSAADVERYKKDKAAGELRTNEVWGADAKRSFGEKREEGEPKVNPWPQRKSTNPFTKASGKAQPKQSDPWASVHKANPFADPDAYEKKLAADRQKQKDDASTRRAVPYSSSAQKLRADKPIALEESSTIDAELKEILSLLEGHVEQEAPPVENDQRARELLDGFKNMLNPQERAEPSACATFLRQLADMAERESGRPVDGPQPGLDEGMFSNLKTSIDKVLRPGKYEDRGGAEFTVKRFNEAHELLIAAHGIIYEFDKPLANKINVVAGEVLKMRNQMRSGA